MKMNKAEVLLKDLVDKLVEIQQDPSHIAIFTSAFIHGSKYTGPTYTKELFAAIKYLYED